MCDITGGCVKYQIASQRGNYIPALNNIYADNCINYQTIYLSMMIVSNYLNTMIGSNNI